MKIFKRRNLPQELTYNKIKYVRNIKASAAYSVENIKPVSKHIIVHVLSRNLELREDLHGKPYTPTKWIFTPIKQLKFEGIDNWNRPIFKDENKNRYGSTDHLFSWGVSFEEVMEHVTVNDILYFGRSFGCEPMGTSVNPNMIELIT